MNRRDFLALAGALPLAGWARDAAPRRLTVLVYLKGGNDGYNTFAPVADPRYRKLRPTLALTRDEIIPVTATHGFHRAMTPLMPAWEAGEVALVQGIGQQEITNQHYRDLEMQFTGAGPGEYLSDGWLTRALAGTSPGPGVHALAFGDLDIREADPMGPFRGGKVRAVHIQHPSEWLAARKLDGTQHLATLPAADAARALAHPATTPLKTPFPGDAFAQALRATAELSAAGLAPPVVHITLNADSGDQHHAFDTHWDQQRYHAATLARLAGGLAAFRAAMQEAGLWRHVLVATYDEFGRCPRENDARGTHHGWATSHVVLGGRVKGGLLGEAPPLIDVFAIDGPPPVIDTRALYTTVVERWMGGSARDIFARRFAPLDLLRA